MSLFHFLRPEWFFAVMPLLLFYLLLTRMQLQSKSWQSFCDQALLPHLFNQSLVKKQKRPLFLLLLAGMLAITALAGPSWEKRPQPVFKKQSALVIMLDLSRSMDAADIKPSRLKRALHKIDDILKQRKEGQTALIVFAADAFTVTPLTEDTTTISSQVKSLSTQIMPAQGSHSEKAIKLAHALFKQSSLLKGHMLLITDGINQNAIDTIRGELSSHYSLSILGVGTEDGAPIPAAEGGFFKDSNGAIVIPKLNPAPLSQLALAGSGSYRQLSTDDSDISHLLSPLNTVLDPEQSESTELNTDSWFEAGPWLLLALLPLAAFTFRKGYLFALLVLVLPHSEPGYAFEFSQLWKNNNQQAKTLLDQNQPGQAAEKFTDPNWKAAAEYKSGQYQKALESYLQLDQNNAENLYNLANTQVQLGQYDEALENYNKVIEKNPNHSAAKHNRIQAEKLQRQQAQQKKNNSKGSDKNKNNKNKEKKSEQQSDNDTDKNGKPSDDSANSDRKQNDNADANKDSEQKIKDDKTNDQQVQSENEKQGDKDREVQENNTDQSLSKEQQQANEQWLRRIPDDPGGLLKRKFRYQSQQRQNSDSGEQQW